MIWLFIGFLGILIIIHMARPRFLRRELSAARFFKQLPQPKETRSRLRFGRPPVSRSFVMQILILLLLLTALFLSWKTFGGSETKGLGVWVVVDTSASMTTIQEGGNRMVAARREVERALTQVREAAVGLDVCYKLSALDMERRDLLTAQGVGAVEQAVNSLEPRALGTDLELIRGLLGLLEEQPETQCLVTHVVVVTDLPAPDWVSEQEKIRVIWRDVGEKVDNIGFTRIRPSRNPLTGLVREVRVEVTAFGTPPLNAMVRVTGPDDGVLMEKPLNWQGDKTWRGGFVPEQPGRYRMRVSPGGAYSLDDIAVIDVGDEQEIRVDWRLRDRGLLRQMGWTEDKAAPHVVVTSRFDRGERVPVLVVGNAYNKGGRGNIVIRDFIEKSPLLEDVNLDAAESLGLRGIELPEGFSPVLRGTDGRVWLAQRDDLVTPGVYVPGLPVGTDDVLGRFSTAVFFNGLRWLLRERPLVPLYTLTGPGEPESSGNRLVLHPDEGNTYRESHSFGSIDGLEAVKGRWGTVPVWPIPLVLAVILFLMERVLVLYGRQR